MATPVSPAVPTPASAGTPVEIALPPPPETLKSVPAVPEAASPPKSEGLSTKQEVNTALEEIAKTLLELKDTRIASVALARQAGEGDMTPMGIELRREVVTGLKQDKELLKDPAVAKTNELTFPEKPGTSAFEEFLKANANKLPKDAATQLVEMINAGRYTIGDIAMDMKSYAPIRESFLTGLLGENHPQFNTNTDILKAVHIEPNPNHLQQLTETFAPDKTLTTKTGGHFDPMIALTVGMMALGIGTQLFDQMEKEQVPRTMH